MDKNLNTRWVIKNRILFRIIEMILTGAYDDVRPVFSGGVSTGSESDALLDFLDFSGFYFLGIFIITRNL